MKGGQAQNAHRTTVYGPNLTTSYKKNIPDRPSVLDKNTLDLGISTVHSPWLDSEVSIAVGSANIEESRVTKSHSSSIASEGLGEISCW